MKKLLSRWFGSAKEKLSLQIKINPENQMMILSRYLEWSEILKIAEKYREKKVNTRVGRKPHLRVLIGAVIVRILKSCTLRETQDLIQHYAPARILCDLRWSLWTPNFRTLSDFEIMLGQEGLAELNAYVLKIAQALGFADIQGLCADTTAQEAQIPYPTEVGLMDRVLRSVGAGIKILSQLFGKSKTKIIQKISEAKKLVRKYRLFFKTESEKRKTSTLLLQEVSSVMSCMSSQIENNTKKKIFKLKKHGKIAYSRLQQLKIVFQKLAPQMEYFIRTGRVARDKIISLFHPTLRAIPRGKAGKKTEFGIRWGINRIRGGYVWLFTRSENGKYGEADYMIQAVQEHIALFGLAPIEFGYDRGGWSEAHIKKLSKLGVKRVAVAPKGQSAWKVSDRCKKRMINERAKVEGTIGTLKSKSYGFNKPDVKKTSSMLRAAQRAGIHYNLTKLLRDTLSVEKQKNVV